MSAEANAALREAIRRALNVTALLSDDCKVDAIEAAILAREAALTPPPSPSGDEQAWPGDKRLAASLRDLAIMSDGNARSVLNRAATALDAREQAVAEAREALKKAEQFIVNGVEMGFIRMPDASTPDPAHGTLPAIRSALVALASRPAAPGERVAADDIANERRSGNFAEGDFDVDQTLASFKRLPPGLVSPSATALLQVADAILRATRVDYVTLEEVGYMAALDLKGCAYDRLPESTKRALRAADEGAI